MAGDATEFAACQWRWSGIRGEIERPAWPAETIQRIMGDVRLPRAFEEREPPVSEPQARQAFLSPHWIRRRITLCDVAFVMGWDREVHWEEARASAGQPSV